jgi:hypothetical protein
MGDSHHVRCASYNMQDGNVFWEFKWFVLVQYCTWGFVLHMGLFGIQVVFSDTPMEGVPEGHCTLIDTLNSQSLRAYFQ